MGKVAKKIQQKLGLDVTGLLATISAVTKDVVQFCRALGDATRWRIVRLVLNDALCICELADILEMPQSSVSSHVQVIRKAGLLESEKCEKWTYFRIEPECCKVIAALDKFFDADDVLFKADSERCFQRLRKRENSCCPGPQSLKTTRK